MLLLPVMMLLIPTTARAQDESRWGIVGSFTPSQSWHLTKLDDYVFDFGDVDSEVSGTDFSIGIARGRTLGGDWGVSFVHRSIEDGSTFESIGAICINDSCVDQVDERYVTQGVTYTGVEAHKFISFVTISRRVQIGMNFAGGIGKFSGQLEKHDFQTAFDFSKTPPAPIRTETVTTEEMEDYVAFTPFLLGKVEAAVAVIIAPGLKIRASGGFNFPGYSLFRVTGVYLFGAN
jgi:hypothetical protein